MIVYLYARKDWPVFMFRLHSYTHGTCVIIVLPILTVFRFSFWVVNSCWSSVRIHSHFAYFENKSSNQIMDVHMYWVSQVSMLLAYRVTYFKSPRILPYILNIFSIHSSEIRGFWCSIKCYSKSNFNFACYFQNSWWF